MVLAEDPKTGIVGPHRVLQLYRNTKDHLRIVNLTNASGNSQRIETTDEHPFWVVSRDEWVIAHDLEPGDELLQADGQTATIISTIHEDHPSGVATYNFEVEGFHTYFVAAHGSTGPPVLVHNACRPDPNNGGGNPHGKADHNAAIDAEIATARANGATNIRKNQAQVDFGNQNKVGTNKPDVQYDLGGKHHNIEFDRTQTSSARHQLVIPSNDPNAINRFDMLP